MGVRKRGRAGASSVLPSPSQETNPDPRPLPPWNSPWHQKAPTPFLTRHLGSLFKVEGGEKKGQGSKWHSKTFFNEKTLAWRWESCPRLAGLPLWDGAQRRLPLTRW